MSANPRRARLRSLAKLNLGLLVLHKRADGYHELRTVFQTISLADTIDVEFIPGSRRAVELESALDIPGNLIVRAATLLMDGLKIRGRARFHLTKTIPMGGGLGGGSSNAATVLLALPVLAGVRVDLEELTELGARLGADVPFFLHGGTALGIGRGTELYPLPEVPERPALVVSPDIHVSTADAYQALDRGLTVDAMPAIMNSLRRFVWREGDSAPGGAWDGGNDFETVVFRQHPLLGTIKRKLKRAGASLALMTGSGSSVFGVFDSVADRDRAQTLFRRERAYPVKLVSRHSYRGLWWRQLRDHIAETKWPPQSRYLKK